MTQCWWCAIQLSTDAEALNGATENAPNNKNTTSMVHKRSIQRHRQHGCNHAMEPRAPAFMQNAHLACRSCMKPDTVLWRETHSAADRAGELTQVLSCASHAGPHRVCSALGAPAGEPLARPTTLVDAARDRAVGLRVAGHALKYEDVLRGPPQARGTGLIDIPPAPPRQQLGRYLEASSGRGCRPFDGECCVLQGRRREGRQHCSHSMHSMHSTRSGPRHCAPRPQPETLTRHTAHSTPPQRQEAPDPHTHAIHCKTFKDLFQQGRF